MVLLKVSESSFLACKLWKIRNSISLLRTLNVIIERSPTRLPQWKPSCPSINIDSEYFHRFSEMYERVAKICVSKRLLLRLIWNPNFHTFTNKTPLLRIVNGYLNFWMRFLSSLPLPSVIKVEFFIWNLFVRLPIIIEVEI